MATRNRILKLLGGTSVIIFISKAIGFLRDIITAYYYGTGIESDAYSSAYSLFYIPILMLSSCITSTIVPCFMRAAEKDGRKGSDRFGSDALNVFMLIAFALSVAMYIFAPKLVSLVYHSFDPEKTRLTSELVRIMLITMVFHVGAIVESSILNARDRYVQAQTMGFPLSICVILSTVLFSRTYGIRATAWGVCASSVAEFLIQLPFLRGVFSYKPGIPWQDREIAPMLRAGGPALLSMAVSELNHMIDRFLASGLGTGAISGMNYAWKLITFLQGVLLVPITNMMFSRLSDLVAKDDRKGVAANVRESVRFVLLITLPITAIGAVMARDVVTFAYMRGNFRAESVGITSGALLFYLVGLPAFGLRDMLNRLFHANKDTRTPFRAAIVTVCTNITLNLILKKFMGVNGLALATSIASYVGLTYLVIAIRKHFGTFITREYVVRLLPIVPGTVAAAFAAGLLSGAMAPARETWSAVGRFAAATGAGLVAYVIVTGLLFALMGKRKRKM